MMKAKVKKNSQVGPDYYKIILKIKNNIADYQPGQFVHLKIASDSTDPLLRRPFSIHETDNNKGIISLIYRKVGKGTKILSNYCSGKKIDLLGPLGQGFRTDFNNYNILVIGGGMGIAPLYYLVKKINKNNRPLVLIGGNNKKELEYFHTLISRLNLEIGVASMDGSVGYPGTVIDLWQKSERYKGYEPDFIYSCGPEPMLKMVQKIAREQKISGQVSLEERMGCGIGVCLSCVCKTKEGNKRLCQEGPVLTLDEVIFNE